jgi:hypothetical protein
VLVKKIILHSQKKNRIWIINILRAGSQTNRAPANQCRVKRTLNRLIRVASHSMQLMDSAGLTASVHKDGICNKDIQMCIISLSRCRTKEWKMAPMNSIHPTSSRSIPRPMHPTRTLRIRRLYTVVWMARPSKVVWPPFLQSPTRKDSKIMVPLNWTLIRD